MKNLKINKFSLYFLTFLVILSYFYYEECRSNFVIIYLIDYLKDVFFSTEYTYQVQFVNESFKIDACYLSLEEKIYDYDQNKILFITYFPRTARIIFAQFLIFTITYYLLISRANIKLSHKSINLRFLLVFISGLFISINLINLTTNSFENSFYVFIFSIFSFLKCYIVNTYLKKDNLHLSLLILCIFPAISTGLGISWFYDLLIYYVIFSLVDFKNYKENKFLFISLISLVLSLIYPLINSPSVETKIINEEYVVIDNKDLLSTVQQKNTFLELEDLNYLLESKIYENSETINKEVNDLAKMLKGIKYPGRGKFLVSIYPDFKFHLPAFVWYFAFLILFVNIFNKLKTNRVSNFVEEFEDASKILIYYQLFSLFLGINSFFNSFSNILFNLQRNAELITFGMNQTWRGISSHYELFSNLQLLSFCFFIITYFLSRKNLYLLYGFVAVATAFLSQSRWVVLIVFIFIFIIFINFYKTFQNEIISLVLFSILIIQFIPVFERNEPFFIYFEESEEIIEDKNDSNEFTYSLGVIEPITDRLNRTLPWKMFATGYVPDLTSLSFGHGPASYLNIVKNAKTQITSGPHSSLLLILNRFGIVGILISFVMAFTFLKQSIKYLQLKNLISLLTVSGLLISIELKTDSLLIPAGVAMFFFNLFLIIILQKVLIEKEESSKSNN
tara:strand:+ start:809 stop:2836 length:2028 start_codon:yes stop_codon:yes gene_type:complete